jgi:Tfp pilus assembly protein PilO
MATKVLTEPTAKKTELTFPVLLATARRRRYMTVSVISWVIIAILAIAVVVPAVQQIVTQMQSINEVEMKIAQQQTKVDGLEKLNGAEIDQANTVLEGALPREKPVLPLLYSLDRLAVGAQVSVSNFQISPGLLGTESGKLDTGTVGNSISPNISALPLKMNVAGGFENLSAFFKSLDNVVPFIQVNSIKFQSADTDKKPATASAQYRADVDLSSLYLKQSPSGELTGNVAPLNEGDKALLDKLSISFAEHQNDSALQATQNATASGRTNLFSIQ